MRKLKFEKKYIPAALLAMACVVVGIFCAVKAIDEIKYNEILTDSSLMELTDVQLIADGGNGTEIPKNTVYAVDDLMLKSIRSIKIDARLTKDKKWVALKNSDISSVTNGKGSAKDYNYFDLLNFNITGYKPSEHPVIELASETAKYAYQNGVSPIIYLHDYDKGAIKNLLSTLKNDGARISAYASDNIKILKYIRKNNSEISLIYYVDAVTDEAIEICKNDGNMSLCFNAKNKANTTVCIEKMTFENVSFLCYGAETLDDIEELYKIGVRLFVTDTVKAG